MRGQHLRDTLNGQLYLNRRRRWAMAFALGAIIVAAILVRSNFESRRGIGDFPGAGGGISADEARDLAFAEARNFGIETDPTVWIARQINFGQYAQLAGERTTAFFGTPDYAPGAVVWVVSMRGEVTAPLLGDATLSFDNLTVVLDAANGEKVHVAAFYADFESDVRIPPFFDPNGPCNEKDRGDLTKIFRSTCPYPEP